MPSSPVKTAERNVLLIEEYDALSVAIQSALSKFAPHHRFHAVRSLAQARQAALEKKPELIILDFDPPHPGAIAFFGEMRRVLPETRVLLIAAGVTPELTAERGVNGALQFLEKPFELVEFGAAVQALLGPWMETGTSRGTLRDLGLDDVALLALASPRNVLIEVRAEEGRTGELHVRNSQITHARTADAEGKRALVEMLTWNNPHFIENIAPESTPRTIHDPWTATLIEALHKAQNLKRARPAAGPKVPAQTAVAPTKTGPKILIVDDTEMLLIFVEDSLALADPTLQMTTALTGLQGVKEAARVKPDLVLVDYVLPDIKGDEVCRRIGRNDSTALVPIIMMSGHVHEMTAVAGKLPNVVATIPKPFLSDSLVALVQQKLKEGPLREKPIFPGEREIAHAKGADFAISKKPVPPQPEQKPPTGRREGGAPGTPKPEVWFGPGSQEFASPRPPTPPPLPIARTTPLQKLEPITPSLAANEVLLDLPLDVVAMQVNAAFQLGAIRARPASLTVAIEIPALAATAASPLKAGFHLGPIDLDAAGCISIVRLIPTSQPFRPVQTRGAFEIGGVAVVPANERERLQLMSTAASRMTMQLFAPLELISVELAPNLEIKQLILRCRGKAVRVSLNSQNSQAQSGASFAATKVLLDQSRRIDELTLTPI